MQTKTWSQKLARRALYDAFWIMGIADEEKALIAKNPVWSLLPIRFYHDGLWEHDVRSSLLVFEQKSESDVMIGEVTDARGCFAKMLWMKAAETIGEAHPDIMELTFSPQEADGVYPIVFRHDPAEIAEEQRRIMRGLIDGGFSIGKRIRVTVEGSKREKTFRYENIDKTGGFRFSLEECEPYFKTFDSRMLTLGNQKRAYRFFAPQNRSLFKAAESGDKVDLARMVNAGASVNEIDVFGRTAFFLMLESMLAYGNEEGRDITDEDERFLDFLFAHGANVNLYGVDEMADPPLFESYLCRAERLFRWLLDHGADLQAEVSCDSSPDDSLTIRDWIDGN